jgi:hypothetical protein
MRSNESEDLEATERMLRPPGGSLHLVVSLGRRSCIADFFTAASIPSGVMRAMLSTVARPLRFALPARRGDSTYYALPSEDNSRRWVERTPDSFVFDVKAYSLFTDHPAGVKRLPKAARERLPEQLAGKRNLYCKDAPKEVSDDCWAAFIDGLLPLHDAGKLGVVVLQLPKWSFRTAGRKSISRK